MNLSLSSQVIRRPLPLVCSLLFVLMGLAFIPQAGIQNDEALFGSGIYEQIGIADRVEIGGQRIPLMLINYLGALKSWVYSPILHFWRPSPASTRVPVILFGALTIVLFSYLLFRIAGDRAAAVGAVLLATDTLFLITTVFDWGPVVFQHLLLVGGVLCLVRFHQERQQRRFLAAGFFLLGLGMWDKALFGWMLSGMAVASVAVFPQELWKYFRFHNLVIAVLAFCLGSAPLIAFNIRHPLETFRANTAYTFDDVPGRARMLRMTLDGQALLGFLTRNDPEGHPRSPQTPVERCSTWLSAKTGGQRINFFFWALLGAVIVAPFLWRTAARRALAFSALAMLIAWLQMAVAKNAGGAVHHAILIWPFPALFTAVAFAEVSRRIGSVGRWLLAAVVAVVACSGLLVTNEYHSQLVQNGQRVTWTDAIYPLSDCLRRVKARTVVTLDWGMFDVLRLLNQGRLSLVDGTYDLNKPELDWKDKLLVLHRISKPESIFVGHPDGSELFQGVNARLASLAAEAGYRRVTIADIADRNGRTMFEVFRFEPVH